MADHRQVTKNMLAQVVVFCLALATSFFLTPFITETLGEETYGFYGLAGDFVRYASIITVALSSMAGRFVSISYNKGDYKGASKYMTSVCFANLTIAALMALLATFAVLFLEHIINIPPNLIGDIKLLYAFVFGNAVISTATSIFSVSAFAKNRMDLSALCSFVMELVRVLLLLALFGLMPARIYYMGFCACVCTLIGAYYYAYMTNRLIPEVKIERKHFDFKAVKEMVSVGVWNSVNQLSQVLLTGLDLLLANLFISPAAMGLMSLSKVLPVQIQAFFSTVSGVFTPQLTQCYATKSSDEFVSEVNYSIKAVGFIASIPVLGVAVFGQSFYTLWLGKGCTESELAVISALAMITLLPMIWSAYISPVHCINTITCKLKVPVLVTLGIGVLNCLIVFLILSFAPEQIHIYAIAAVSSVLVAIRTLVFAPIYAAHVLKLKLSVFYPPILRASVAAVIVAVCYFAVNYFVTVDGWFEFALVVIPMGAVGYVINYFVVLNKSERKRLVSAIMQKLKRKKV